MNYIGSIYLFELSSNNCDQCISYYKTDWIILFPPKTNEWNLIHFFKNQFIVMVVILDYMYVFLSHITRFLCNSFTNVMIGCVCVWSNVTCLDGIMCVITLKWGLHEQWENSTSLKLIWRHAHKTRCRAQVLACICFNFMVFKRWNYWN